MILIKRHRKGGGAKAVVVVLGMDCVPSLSEEYRVPPY